MTKEEGPCVSPRRVRVAQKGHGSATGPAASPSGTSMFTYAPVCSLARAGSVYPIDAVDPERVGTIARRDYGRYCLVGNMF